MRIAIKLALFVAGVTQLLGLSQHFRQLTIPSIAGGWGSVAVAPLMTNRRSAIITANRDANSITIYFSN